MGNTCYTFFIECFEVHVVEEDWKGHFFFNDIVKKNDAILYVRMFTPYFSVIHSSPPPLTVTDVTVTDVSESGISLVQYL